MKSYLTHLYEMDLHEHECDPITTPSYHESSLYDELMKDLPKEHLQKFIDFINTHEGRLADECEIYFKKGFRYAVRLILECFNEKF